MGHVAKYAGIAGDYRGGIIRPAHSAILVTKKRTKRTSDLPRRYHLDHRARRAKHATARKGNTFSPNLPDGYLDGSISKIDVKEFKKLWDTSLCIHPLVIESKNKIENLERKKKFAL